MDYPSIGSTVFGMGSTAVTIILTIVIISIVGAIVYGIWRWKRTKKQYTGVALIFNPDGTWFTDKIGKIRGFDKLDKCRLLKTKETMPVIDSKHFRGGKVTLYRYGPGQYAIIPHGVFEKIDLRSFHIELVSQHMKGWVFLEQRASITRWAFVKDQLQKYAPFITLLILAVLAGVIIYFIMNGSQAFFNQGVAARIAECAKITGYPVTPAA